MQKDLAAKELENRNTIALQQLAEMVDTVSGIGSIVTKHLYEKGLEMPVNNQQTASRSCSRNRSRTSMRSSGRNSEYSLNLSRDDDGIISRSILKFDKKVHLLMLIYLFFSLLSV